MSDSIAALDAVAQAERVRSGELTPAELVEGAISRIERLDGKLGSVIHRAFDEARQAARDPSLPDGPFRGVPFLMKDIGGEEAGRPNHMGMAALKRAGWLEPTDSYFARRIRSSGFVSLGRTNTPELALLPTTEPEAYGATRNPWNLDRIAGGSSGGAAAAVAAGLVPVAHASDGGGSIRGPASVCGLVGLKPTRGRNSFGPGRGERWSGFSCEFVVSRSVRDSAALLDVTSGPMPGDPYSAAPPERPFSVLATLDPGPLRIGFMRAAPRDLEIDAECVRAVEAGARALEELGHHVEEAHPPALEDPGCVANYVRVVTANTARALESTGAKLGRELGEDDVEPLTWALASQGRQLGATGLLETLEFVHGFGRRVASWWHDDGFDLLLTPTQGAVPAPLGHITSTREEPFRAFLRAAPFGVFTLPFNLTGQPAISLPLHWTDDGLPLGIQLVADTGREDLLLQVAGRLEAVRSWSERWPATRASDVG
ncbi:MAG: amidase [Myxococcota bacterium]